MDIVIKSLPDMLLYARSKDVNEDILLPELKITDGKVSISLLVNTDGAVVSKSPVLSAWPLFLAIADLPPRKRQAFENIMLGSFFVGSGHPYSDCIFAHIKKELSVIEYIDFEGQKLAVSFKPILLIADLIAKAKALKMKQCNGYYGCTLCTQRGTHYAGAHQYPPDQPIVMRSADSHLINIRELESRSNKMKSKHGPENDSEIRTQGLKGRSEILSLIPNQPLSSPVDPMHQLFLGVSKELFLFFYDKMHTNEKRELNEFFSSLKLPHEFKNSFRSLDALHIFKAKELKFVLFYLSPVAFPPFFHGEDRVSDEIDLKNLVFATRSLFNTIANADFSDRLLNEFCRSMAEKTEKMESINFHLLRHLGWQAKNIGPLFTTSASMFESGNCLLIAPLTGTVNQCQLMTSRFIRAKSVLKMELREDCLSSVIKDFQGNKKIDEIFALFTAQKLKNFRKFIQMQSSFAEHFTSFISVLHHMVAAQMPTTMLLPNWEMFLLAKYFSF